MALFKKKNIKPTPTPLPIQTSRSADNSFYQLNRYVPLKTYETELFDAMREAVPIIDAAICKTVRLLGSFSVSCGNKKIDDELNAFLNSVNVSYGGVSIGEFISRYLDSLLCYGTAVGEIVLSENGDINSLFISSLDNLSVIRDEDTLDARILVRDTAGNAHPVPYPDRLLFTTLSPKPDEVVGSSILKGLPFVSSILLKIYKSIGSNFERIGNLRYAVTYKPSDNAVDKAYAKDRATLIAKEWSDAMSASKSGDVRDFVAVGDVDIKVIGSDNQILDTNVPVRQMLEQIVAKLGIPPFLLGLNWSSTERMSKQQADILTSELEAYRRLLTPVILKICTYWLRLRGYSASPSVSWDIISMQDEVDIANARYLNAQADAIILQNEKIKAGETDV
ncbi:MAG: serine/threonine protein phosphatase [Oscillospiraceae bacterium]|nr:serine/threonine protein phosphatase [Oscillospiraceae bacterium]